MKILKIVVLALAGLLAILVAVGALLPRQWNVEKTVTVAAPAEVLYARVNNLRRWQEWAAWNKAMDPEVKYTYAGPSEGVGATWSWDGPKMGKGSMTITRSDPAIGVWVDEKIQGDEVNAHGSITWVAEGANTKVTWVDTGPLPPVVGGYFKGFIEKMLGEQFQTGLDELKAQAEAEAVEQAKAAEAQPELEVAQPTE